jgi:hypothetical protein
MRKARLVSRLAVVLGGCLTLIGLLCGPAFASPSPVRAEPTLTRTWAKFKIPTDASNLLWTMTLYTCAPSDSHCRTTLLEASSAHHGTIAIKVPPQPGCTYQVNIQRGKKFYDGQRDTFTPCSTTVATSSTTSTTKPRTTGTSGGNGGSSGGTGGTSPTTPTGALAFTGAGAMLDVLAGVGALLALAGIAVLWYMRPRRPAVSYWR